jgi:hypothetical protein
MSTGIEPNMQGILLVSSVNCSSCQKSRSDRNLLEDASNATSSFVNSDDYDTNIDISIWTSQKQTSRSSIIDNR